MTFEGGFVILKSFSETIDITLYYKQNMMVGSNGILTLISEYLYKTSFTDRKEAYDCYGSYKKASGTGKDTFGTFRI